MIYFMHNNLGVPDDICKSVTFDDLSSMTFSELSNLKLNEISNISSIIKALNQGRRAHSISIPEDSQLTDINDAYNSMNLSLVLGAGISKDCGLPDWKNLLKKMKRYIRFNRKDIENQSLIIEKIFFKLFSRSDLILARNLHRHCSLGPENADNMVFEKFVRCSLYKEKKLNYTKLLTEIVRLSSFHDGEKFLDSIITYNYDDILEYFLEINGNNTRHESIYYSDQGYSDVEALPIYHVHGFLPRRGNLTAKNKIILDEESYHILYNDVDAWNNSIQLEKFTDNKCLLIGLSLNDPNLRRLLDAAYKKRNNDEFHHIIALRPELNEYRKKLKNLLTSDKNVLNKKISDGLEFEETVKMVRGLEERFFEEDALSLGVQTIWAKNGDDIAKRLQQIKKGA